MSERAIRVGVSSCLLGERVRYDAGHKRDRFVSDVLGPFVEWVPVCPEVEAGLGLPRPAMRLSRQGDELRMLETRSGRDHTLAMQRYAASRVRALRELDLCGYVLKKDSPSCGMTRVKVYQQGRSERNGTGLFAAALMQAMPELPVEEEGRLVDPRLRESFIERVFAFRRLRDCFAGRWTAGRVVAFHSAEKLNLMAHGSLPYRALGRLVAEQKRLPRAELRERYVHGFMAALARPASRGRNTNVLQHAAGLLKRRIDAEARRELASLIEDYRAGLVPIVVPITLLRHHARVHQVDYLNGQSFLEPHPKELMLRNHV